MCVKSIFCKIRDKLFLNAVKNGVREVVKNELSQVVVQMTDGGARVAELEQECKRLYDGNKKLYNFCLEGVS